MMRWLALTPLLCALCACDVASVREAPSTIAHNECQTSADCAGGNCVDQQCRSATTELQSLLFEVTPPADGSAIAGVQFLVPKELNDSSQDEGGATLALGPVSQVAGRVTAEGRKCSPKFVGELDTLLTASDFSIPARVSLIPTTSALGLYSPRTVVRSDIVEQSYWGFSANVAPGTYDIYVEPNPQPDETCPVPPQLLRGQVIMPGTLPLKIALPEPSLFELHVTWPAGDGALDGWMVDMLDPTSGRVVSDRVPLVLASGGKTDYVASVSFDPVVIVGKPNAQQDQLLRLSPPDGLPDSAALPTVLMARSALGLFAAGHGTLSDFTSLPTTVHVHGQVTSGDTPNPVAATVTLVATKITGIDPGVLASFVRTVSVGDDGLLDVYLPPGTYRVSTVPQAPLDPSKANQQTPLAADTREWIVPSTPAEQAGKLIGLSNAVLISGQVDAPGGPVAAAQVQAVASARSIQVDVLQQSLTGPPLVPRASAGGVSSTGDFSLKADPGTFDISVRPNTDTGFSWLVLPNVLVIPSFPGLGHISMPLPLQYRGTVTAGVGGPVVPGALVRAYAYMKGGQYTAAAAAADSVLQVAETRANNDGVFDILIPAQLNQLP